MVEERADTLTTSESLPTSHPPIRTNSEAPSFLDPKSHDTKENTSDQEADKTKDLSIHSLQVLQGTVVEPPIINEAGSTQSLRFDNTSQEPAGYMSNTFVAAGGDPIRSSPVNHERLEEQGNTGVQSAVLKIPTPEGSPLRSSTPRQPLEIGDSVFRFDGIPLIAEDAQVIMKLGMQSLLQRLSDKYGFATHVVKDIWALCGNVAHTETILSRMEDKYMEDYRDEYGSSSFEFNRKG